MKHNKNADSFLFLLLFTMKQREKILKKHWKKYCKTLFVSAGAQKSDNQRVMGTLYHNIYQNQKIDFQ